jgi:hypothetical protein
METDWEEEETDWEEEETDEEEVDWAAAAWVRAAAAMETDWEEEDSAAAETVVAGMAAAEKQPSNC